MKTIHIKNGDLEATILNYGASIYELKYKGVNTVLNYKDLQNYKTNKTFLGATVGRVAGRISNAQFHLNGKIFYLDKNEFPNSTHGGLTNLTTKSWDLETKTENSATFTTSLKDGDSGYPGNLNVKVIYDIKDNTLNINYIATSDKDTIVNITNHSYFNLNTNHSKITNHTVQVLSDRYIALKEDSIPDKLANSEKTAFNLNQHTPLKDIFESDDAQIQKFDGIDHPFELSKKHNFDAKLNSEESNIQLTVKTSYPYLVIYSGNQLDESFEDSQGRKVGKYQGICFEAQYAPDFINQDYLDTHILKANEEYNHTISFGFEEIK